MSHQLSFNTSSFVDDLIPPHIAANYPDLIEFIKVYALFLEKKNTSTFYLNQLDQQRDIDLIEEELLNELQNEIGVAVPRTFASDPRLFYKHLIEFYRSRGTPDAIQTFFRLIHDESVEVYFPKDDILAPSDGSWGNVSEAIIQNHIDLGNGGRCSDRQYTDQTACELAYCTAGMYDNKINCQEAGYDWVDSSIWSEINALSYTPMHTWTIANTPIDIINIAVDAGPLLTASVDDKGFPPTLDNIYFVNGVYVENATETFHERKADEGFEDIVNAANDSYLKYMNNQPLFQLDPIYIEKMLEIDSGFIAFGDADMDGDLDHIDISLWFWAGMVSEQYTWNTTTPESAATSLEAYSAEQIAKAYEVWNATKEYFTQHVDRSNASKIIPRITLPHDQPSGPGVSSIVTAYKRGNFADDSGKPNALKYIQDSYFYQKFSYVLRTGVDKSKWSDSFKRLAHPAGFIFFGEIYVFVTILEKGMPSFQPGWQQGGLPFNIFIPSLAYGDSINISDSIVWVNWTGDGVDDYALGPLITKSELSFHYDFDVRARIGAYDHFENTKFSNWRPVRDYREFTIQDVINKDINIHIGAEVIEQTGCSAEVPAGEFYEYDAATGEVVVNQANIDTFNNWVDTCILT